MYSKSNCPNIAVEPRFSVILTSNIYHMLLRIWYSESAQLIAPVEQLKGTIQGMIDGQITKHSETTLWL